MGFHNQNQVQHRHSKKSRRDSVLSRSDSSCLSGGFYTNPTSGSSINSLNALNITWDTSCLTPAGNVVDIYLYAPSASTPRIHIWESVPYKQGWYNATLMPRWWNSTASEQLQLLIIESGDAPFMATLPPGPVFTATYVAPSSGTPAAADTSLNSDDSGITTVAATSSSSSKSGLSKGKIAAATIHASTRGHRLRRSRAKGKVERKKWTEKVDQRMSVVSADWASMSVPGAQAAIRNSMAVRASMDHQRMSSASMGMENVAGLGIAPGGGVGGFFIPGQGDPNVNPIVSMPVPSHIPEVTAPSTPPLRGTLGTGVARESFPSLRSRVFLVVLRAKLVDPSTKGLLWTLKDVQGTPSIREEVVPSTTLTEVKEDTPPLPEGAAERASAFYLLNNAPLASSGAGMRGSAFGHMNVSSSTLNSQHSHSHSGSSSANASRMSRFDEVYGDLAQQTQNNRSSGGDYSQTSYEDFSVASPDAVGPVALSSNDIQKRVRGANGSLSSGQASAGSNGFEEDVGPALSMMRAQELEQEDYFALNLNPATLRHSTVSETIFAASPSPYETSFEVPAFPMPPIATAHSGYANPIGGGFSMPTPSLNGSPIVSTTSPVTYPATSATTGGAGIYMAPPKNGMSPDDMLRAYAGRQGSPSPSPDPSSPMSSSTPLPPSSPSSYKGSSKGGLAKSLSGHKPSLKIPKKLSMSNLRMKNQIANPSPLAREVPLEDEGVYGMGGEAI
ncbi:hypothetical protein BT96DRAFT_931836 [Gymnopus androsaceus JB14]|uniref:Uncharacterized protein n=1 Tax=Gymnopus androsaceus JB14 TaxID=1447944 RepID=A0A6A4IGI4_9AGAR|nr:hypothetical protein BT96DRAFT_931836 [Gymnopus androsaceus JB14]